MNIDSANIVVRTIIGHRILVVIIGHRILVVIATAANTEVML